METPEAPATTNPEPATPETAPIPLAGRIAMGMFLLGVILFGIFLVGELLAGIFR